MTKSKGILQKRCWTDAEIAAVRARYPHERTADIAKGIGRRESQVYQKAAQLGLKKSAEYLASPAACRLRRGDNVGAEHRFKPGQAVWNKGMKGLQMGGKATQFKPGQMPVNHKPVGSTRIDEDGYVWIKTAEPNKFEMLHRVKWREAYGELPPKGYALGFKDGNKQNCDVGNLELLTRAELMNRNTRHRLPKELSELIHLRAQITRQINKRAKNEQ